MKNPLFFFLICSFLTVNGQKDTVKNHQLNEIEISGVRAQHKDPVSQSNLLKDDVCKNYAGQDFASLILTKAPSLTGYSDGGNSIGYMYLKMRGIDQNRMNFTFNGISLAEPEDNGFYPSNFTDFLNNVNSIQIQRGVGISPSGIGNLVGSVNFESPNLSDSLYHDIQLGYGSFNSSRISACINTGIQKSGFAVYGRYSNNFSSGYRYNSGTDAHTFFTSIGYYGKKDIFKLTAFSGSSKNQMAYLPTNLSDIQKDPRTNYLNVDEKDDFRQNFIQLQHTRNTGKNSFITSSLYHIDLQGQYGVLIKPTLLNFSLSSNLYGVMSTWNFTKSNFNLKIGGNAYTYVRFHSMAIAPEMNTNIYLNKGNKNEVSAFTKLSYKLNKITLFGDAQYRNTTFSYKPSKDYTINVKPVNWTFLNLKGGITYEANTNSSYYVSIGQMYREPTRNDMFAGFDDVDTSNYALIGNLYRVKPESVIDYEAGYRLNYKKLHLSINGFYMEFKNQIVPTGPYSYIGLPLTQNLNSNSRRYGLEIEYFCNPIKNLTLSGNSTIMKAKIDKYTSDFDSTSYENITPLLTPQYIVNQSISYSFLKQKIDLTLTGRYVGTQYLGNDNNNNLIVPEALTFNVALLLNVTKRLNISFLCNNITNQRIYNGGYSIALDPYYFIGAPRNFFLTLKHTF